MSSDAVVELINLEVGTASSDVAASVSDCADCNWSPCECKACRELSLSERSVLPPLEE